MGWFAQIARMLCRVWFLLFAAALLLVAAEPVPGSVAEYRARVENPEVLAEEILLAAQETAADEQEISYSSARQLVAVYLDRSTQEIEKALEVASALMEQQAKAASNARAGGQLQPDVAKQYEEARLWARLAKLHLAAGRRAEVVTARRHQLEALAGVASPEEWLQASLGTVKALSRSRETADAERREQLLELARKMVDVDGLLADDATAIARVKACEAWVEAQIKRKPVEDQWTALAAAAEGLSKALGINHPETLEAKAALGAIPVPANGLDALVALWKEIIAGREATLGANHPIVLEDINHLGNLLWRSSGEAEAYPHLRRAFDGCLASFGLYNRHIASSWRVALFEYKNGDYTLSEETHRKLIEAATKLLKADDRVLLTCRASLATVLSQRGDYAGAEKLNREVLEIRNRTFGSADSDTLLSMNNTAASMQRLGKRLEAEDLFRRTLAISKDNATIYEFLRTKNNVANCRLDAGDLVEAERIFTEVLAKRLEKLGATHTDTLSTQSKLVDVYLQKGDLGLAERYAREVLEERQQSNGEMHPTTINALATVAKVLTAKGEHPKALETAYRALHLREARYGKDEPGYLATARLLAMALLEAGNFDEAENQLRPVLAAYEKRNGVDHPETFETSAELGGILLKKGELGAAEPLLRGALEKSESFYDATHPVVASISYSLSELLQQKGQTATALPLAERASAIAKEKFPENRRLRERYDGLLGKLRGQP